MQNYLSFSKSHGLILVWGMMAAFGVALLPCRVRAQAFTPPKNVSNTPANISFQQRVAVGPNGDIYVVWSDGTQSDFNILFSRSTDHGQTFSAPINISNNSGFAGSPDMVVDASGGVDVFWNEGPSTSPGLYFARSSDGGVSFSAPQNISPGVVGQPRCVVDSSGGIDVVWYGSNAYGWQIFFSRSTDAGSTFSTPASVSGPASFAFNPKVATDSHGNIDVTWEDNPTGNLDIFFSHSSDGGNNFASPVNLSHDAGRSTFPQMAVDPGGNVYVVWQDDTASQYVPDVLLARSTDAGNSFTVSNLSKSAGSSVDPVVAVSPTGTVDVSWIDNTTGGFNIFFARSTDQGASFSTPSDISPGIPGSEVPQMSVDAHGNVNIAWDTGSGGGEVFFARSADDGATFSLPQNISKDSGLSVQPTLAVDSDGNINVVWQDDTGLQFEVYDIFYSRGAPLFLFSSFVPKLDISTHGQVGFQFKASFTLNASSDGILPGTEPLALQIGSYTLTLPPGSFALSSTGDYVFTGTIGGSSIQARLSPTGAGSYVLQIDAQGPDLSGVVNPAKVVLAIGNDTGTATVAAEFLN